MPRFRELVVPDELSEGEAAREVCRVFIGTTASFVSLDLDLFGKKPEQWGYVLADIANHVAKGLTESGEFKSDDVYRAIEAGYSKRMSSHLELVGRHLGSKH